MGRVYLWVQVTVVMLFTMSARHSYAVSPLTCDIGVLEVLARYQNDHFEEFSKATGSLAGISKIEFLIKAKKTWLKLSGTSYPKKKKCSANVFYEEENSKATYGCPPVKIMSIANDCD